MVCGIGSFILILRHRDAAAPLSDALAPAVQALFAAVLAAFGITQMLIARDAMRVARRSVAAMNEQTEIMQLQVAHAKEDSAQRSWEADQALSLARIERLDGHAPKVALVTQTALLGPPPEWDDGRGIYASDSAFDSSNTPWPDLLYMARFHLINYGDSPIRFTVDVNDPRFHIATARNCVAKVGESEILVQRRHAPQEWVAFASEHSRSFRDTGDDSFLVIKVSVEGPSRFVRDVHELHIGPPPVRRTGERIELLNAGQVDFDKLGSITRSYIASSHIHLE
jgi:hypothetical protein